MTERYTITVAPMPEARHRPVAVRLRQALRYLGRTCGLRCVSVEREHPAESADHTERKGTQ